MVFAFKGMFMESIMAVCKSYELECDGWGGGLWLRAPITHRMYGLSLGGHRHGGWVHVRFSTQPGIVESGGMLL